MGKSFKFRLLRNLNGIKTDIELPMIRVSEGLVFNAKWAIIQSYHDEDKIFFN
jgi:hypothetical protein